MLKFTGFLLCGVLVSLSCVSAIGDKEREAIRESLSPIIDECGQGHDNDAGSCFAGCFFGKLGVVDADGVYNPDNAIKSINAYLKDFGNLSRFEEVAKKCIRVNERPVSKGNEICERSQMAIDCGLEHKSIETQYKFISAIIFGD